MVCQFSLVSDGERFCQRRSPGIPVRNLLRRLNHDVVPAASIPHLHVEWGRGRTLLTIAIDVEAVIPGPLPSHLDGRRVAVALHDPPVHGRNKSGDSRAGG
jgi:hypothetical protein